MRKITTEEQKDILLDMLKTLDRFCEEQNIRYFMASGSLLGTIRHKGFIPWDDDIDVVMPRNDYERFLSTFHTLKPYRVISIRNNDQYYLQFGKLIAENTILKEPVDSDLKLGVYIDLFPLDNMSDDYEVAKKFYNQVDRLKKKLMIRNYIWLDQRPLYQNLIIKGAKAIVHGKRETMLEQIDRKSRTFQSNTFSKYVGVVCSGTYGYKEIMESEWYREAMRMPFEDMEVSVPVGYDKILRQMYGDYMEWPPLEKRVSRHTYEVWSKI